MSLLEICKEIKIPSIEASHEKYAHFKPTHKEILTAAQELTEQTNGNLILIGGQTVHPEILGYKAMRSPSDDIDCISNAQGIENLAKLGLPLGFIQKYGCIFTDFKGFPVFITTDKIHNWQIPKELIDSAIHISGVNACPPEYTIMMKTRRAQEHKRFFGKDRLDIAALMLAPSFRPELRDLDYSKIQELIYTHTNLSPRYFISSINEAKNHLNPKERALLLNISKRLEETN